MALPEGYNFKNYLPKEKDFLTVLEHKKNYNASTSWYAPYMAEGPYYYEPARYYIAAILLKWDELARKIEEAFAKGYYSYDNGVKTFHEYLTTEQLKDIRQLAVENKAIYADVFNKYKKYAWDTESPEARVGAKKAARKGEITVKIKNNGNLIRLIPYSMKYGYDPDKTPTGNKMHVFVGNEIGGKYNIVIRGSNLFGERSLHKIYNQPFFTTEQEARDFIANFDHNHINTKVTIEDFRWTITDQDIDNGGHYKTDENGEMIYDDKNQPIYIKTPFKPKLEDAVKVDTVCGPVYLLKDLLDDWKERMAKWKAEQKEKEEAENMNEAIEKHDTLNPKLFDDMKLKPEIRQKAQDVVNEFLRILAEDEVRLDVRDVILTGSNASYNYTADSDVDLHILANTTQFDDPEQLHKKLYNCYRRIFESKFDISFYGIPVEVYVETEDNPVVSNGIYSVMYDQWVKEPTHDYVKDVDQEEITKFAKPWIDRANEVIKKVDDNLPDDEEEIDKYLEDIYEMRQQGIYNTEGSEFSPENLAFKEVRNAGLLDKLKDLKNRVIERRLSLEEAVGYLDDAHEFKDYGTAEVEGGNVIDTNRASTFATQDLLDHSEDAAYEGIVYDIVDLTPIQYFELCGKVQHMDPEEMMDYIKSDERQLAHIKDVILKYHKRLQMPYVSFSKMDEVSGQEGRHRMYALGEMFGWDKEFPVMVVQDLGAKKTIGELLHESITESFDLTEKERRDYIVKITQLTHHQPIVQNNGIFEIYNVPEDESMQIVSLLSRQSWTEFVQRTAGRFDFGNWKTIARIGTPARLYTIRGKLRVAPVHELVYER